MRKRTDLGSAFVRSILDYDPDSGIFRWKSGRQAGARQITIDGCAYKTARLAWLVMTDAWPDEIDHRSCDDRDNRFSNLRESTRSGNMWNQRRRRTNTSGFKGVTWDKRERKWRAQICAHRKKHTIGYFADAAEAHVAYCRRAAELHGEFARFE